MFKNYPPMDNQTATLVLIAIATPTFAAMYFYYTTCKTHKKYVGIAKELIKAKEELIKEKTELIRKIGEIKEYNLDNKFLKIRYSDTSLALVNERYKLNSVLQDIQSIGRRISIKDLEAFKQRCADIYSETTPD